MLLWFFSRQRYWFLLLLTFILNILVLVSYHVPTDQGATNSTNSTNRTVPAVPELSTAYRINFYVLGGVHTFFALWLVLEYFIVNGKHFVLPKFLCQIPLPHKEKLKWVIISHSSLFLLICFLASRIPLLSEFTRTKASINVLGFTTIYIVVFLVASVLSLAFFGYFYCICLLYVTIDNDILQRALRSTTKNCEGFCFPDNNCYYGLFLQGNRYYGSQFYCWPFFSFMRFWHLQFIVKSLLILKMWDFAGTCRNALWQFFVLD